MAQELLTWNEIVELEAEKISAADILGGMIAHSSLRELMNANDYETFLTYLYDDAVRNIAEVMPALADQIRASITRTLSPEEYQVALMKAAEEARIRAQTTVTQMARTSLNAVGREMADGLQAGLHPWRIARRLEAVSQLDSQRYLRYKKWMDFYQVQIDSGATTMEKALANLDRIFDTLLKERRETIAATEARHITSQIADDEARDRDSRYKSWVSSAVQNVCEQCEMNQGQGPIGMDETFSSGHDLSPAHPDCHCHVIYGTSDDQRDRMVVMSEIRQEELNRAREEAARTGEAVVSNPSAVPPAPAIAA